VKSRRSRWNRAAAKHTHTDCCTTAIRVSVLCCGAQQRHDKHTQTTREYSRGETANINKVAGNKVRVLCWARLPPFFICHFHTAEAHRLLYKREPITSDDIPSSISTVFIDICKAAGPAQHPSSSLCAMEKHCDFL
jgi:hypothetical protein